MPAVEADITVGEYAVRWLQMIRPQLKVGTVLGYESVMRIHVLPRIGDEPVRKLTRATVKELIVAARRQHTQHTCQRIHRTLRAMLSWAMDDDLILSNPAERLGKVLKLHKTRAQRQDVVRAMTRKERDRFMAAARRHDPDLAGLFMVMGWAGLRIGEALALRAEDVDVKRRELHVVRSIASSDRQIGTTKTGVGRVVMCSAELRSELQSIDMSPMQPAAIRRAPMRTVESGQEPDAPYVSPMRPDANRMRPMRTAERQSELLRNHGGAVQSPMRTVMSPMRPSAIRSAPKRAAEHGQEPAAPAGGPMRFDTAALLFPSARGTPYDHSNVEKRMKVVLRRAGLGLHFTPHSLRHTYARLMLEGGVDLKTVQQQMGHASIQLTADTYGQWFRPQSKKTADVLDSGSKRRQLRGSADGL